MMKSFRNLSCLPLAALLLFFAVFLWLPAPVRADDTEIDEEAVYQAQIIERANALYRRLSASHDTFTGYITYTQRNLDSYESSLRQSGIYNDYKDEMISFTETFADIGFSYLKGDIEGMASTVTGAFVDEVTKGVLPRVTVDQFIYAQAWEGSKKVTISRLWDFKDLYESGGYEFTTYDDAADFIVTVQANKLGFAALSMGKNFYMDQLSESPWSLLGGIAKDLLVSQVLSFLPSFDWIGEWGGGYAYNTLLDGIETLATESDNPFIGQWKSDIDTINSETMYLLRLDRSDPNLYPAHTVFLDPNGGKVSRTSITVHETCPYGYIPTPYRFGYTFDGWYSAAEGGTRYTSVSRYNRTGDQTLYAHWTHTVMTQGECGPALTWVLYGDGILEISGSGEMTSAPWVEEWTECISQVILPDGLTNIFETAFSGLSNLTEIRIPGTVTSIGDFAFAGSGLTSLTLPASLEYLGRFVLCDNEGVKSLTLPASLQQTGYGPYYTQAVIRGIRSRGTGSRGPESVITGSTSTEAVITGSTDPEAVITGSSGTEAVITGSTGPEAVTTGSSGSEAVITGSGGTDNTAADPAGAMESAVEVIVTRPGSGGALSGSAVESVVFENGVTQIWKGVCDNALHLSSVRIPSTVTEIGEKAFAGCPSLYTLTLPDSVRVIGDYAFGMEFEAWDHWAVGSLPGMTGAESGLRSLTLPASLQTLGQGILLGNPYVERLTIPATVTEAVWVTWGSAVRNVTIRPGMTVIPEEMFAWCTALEHITLPEGLREIRSGAFYNSGLLSLELPDSLEKMGGYVLQGCTGVTELTIPAALTDIDPDCLYYSSIERLAFAEGYQEIPDYAFRDLYTLQHLYLPPSVEQIGLSAFENCSALSELDYHPRKLPELDGPFIGTALPLTLLVPPAFDLPYDPERGFYGMGLEHYMICGEWYLPSVIEQAGGLNWEISDESILTIDPDGYVTPLDNGTATVTLSISGYFSETFDVTVRGVNILRLPAGLKEIEEEAFMHLDAEIIILPEGLEKIGPGAFRACRKLQTILIPDSVQEIGEGVFDSCPSIALYCQSENSGYAYGKEKGINTFVEWPENW